MIPLKIPISTSRTLENGAKESICTISTSVQSLDFDQKKKIGMSVSLPAYAHPTPNYATHKKLKPSKSLYVPTLEPNFIY